MAFEEIEFLGPRKPSALPAEGMHISARALRRRGGGGTTRFIRIAIGAKLAKRLALATDEARLQLLFGTGGDAGKLRLSVDVTAGQFRAKRGGGGQYTLTINEQTAEGLFALEFPPFTIAEIEPQSRIGSPPWIDFDLPPAMLEGEAD